MVDPILVGAGITAGITAGVTAGGFIYSIYDPTKVASVKLRTEDGEFEPVIETPRKKHGLIVLGNRGNKRLRKNFENTSDLVYRTLREHGYDDENLYLLEGERNPSKRFSCHSLPSSKEHLRVVLDHLYRDVTSKDAFFMYVLTHGGTTGVILPIGQSTFSLDSGGTVREKELEELLSDLHPDHSLTYFNSCHSGGFARRLGKGRNIAISTSRKDKVTSGWVGTEIEKTVGSYASPFTLFFYSALTNQMPNGENLSLKNISIEKAFDYAASRQHTTKDARIGGFGKNTPHLVYGKINPRDVKL